MTSRIVETRSTRAQPTGLVGAASEKAHTRRRLLGTVALAAPAVALATSTPAVSRLTPAADPDVAWAAEVARLRTLTKGDVPDPDALADLTIEVEDRMLTTPAATLAGAREQVAAAVRFFEDYHEDGTIPETEGLRLAVATMDALLGREAGHA